MLVWKATGGLPPLPVAVVFPPWLDPSLAWHNPGTLAILLQLLVIWALWRRLKTHSRARQRERGMREELEAYARLDASLPPGGDARPLARRVCVAIIQKSLFERVAMLVRNPEGKLYVAGSAGMDDLAVAALQTWGEEVIRQERGLGADGPVKPPPREHLGSDSFVVTLAPPSTEDTQSFENAGLLARRGCRRVIATIFRSQSGSILGAIAVGADEFESRPAAIEDAMTSLEPLAVKLARSIENTSLTDRLMRAERLAGLGQLAGGVAHELNNPLTAVLGFAELIAEISSESRVREDASTIIHEALRMKETVQSLLNFWRPVTQQDEAVSVDDLLVELAADCERELKARGVQLIVQTGGVLPEVRGNRERLRQVLQHLLNNSAQAIANSQENRRKTDPHHSGLPRGSDQGDRSPVIRITVSNDTRTIHLIVSDTGPGFPEPARVFDPFYTTRPPGGGTGLGLSICYGIVREHGGEISAFNLHPHGAAVVLELPIATVLAEDEQAAALIRDDAHEFGIQTTDERRKVRHPSA